MAGLRKAMDLEGDAEWPPNEELDTERARAYFLKLVLFSAPVLMKCCSQSTAVLLSVPPVALSPFHDGHQESHPCWCIPVETFVLELWPSTQIEFLEGRS